MCVPSETGEALKYTGQTGRAVGRRRAAIIHV